MKGKFPVERFQNVRTPFYYYDTELLRQTLRAINAETERHEGWHVHYAIRCCASSVRPDSASTASAAAR